jgi:hypothetical protein
MMGDPEGPGKASQDFAWCRPVPVNAADLEARAAGMALLDRRRKLITAHRAGNLKIWLPQDTGAADWLATWTGGEHREPVEGDLYDWLLATLGPGAQA